MLVNNEIDYLRKVMKPNFKAANKMGPELISCEMGKTKVVMNKPVYLGQAILDLSKIIMYEFHYDYMKKKYARSTGEANYGERLRLCYMDTDSLVYEIQTNDFYKDIAEDVEKRFDTSGYKEGKRPLKSGVNKKVIGLMKDEMNGEIIKEFVSLRPKMYAYSVGGVESKKCKGIKKCVVKKTLKFDDYKSCLLNGVKTLRS